MIPDADGMSRDKATKRFCSDVEGRLKDMIIRDILEIEDTFIRDSLYMEILQHARTCQRLAGDFYGRNETLQVHTAH